MAPDTPATKKIFFEQSITWLYAPDEARLDRLDAFYGGTLELPFVMDQHVAGGRTRIYRASPSHFLGLCAIPNRALGVDGMIFTFLVADVAAAYAHYVARGVAFDGPPGFAPGKVIHSCFFRDPEGYRLELQEFSDPRWPYPEGRAPRQR